jgi:hypothetical protein
MKTTNELYKLIKEHPELEDKYPLIRTFVNTYEVFTTGGGEGLLMSLGKILETLGKNPPPELLKLMEEKLATSTLNLELPEKQEPPEWFQDRYIPPVQDLPPLSQQIKSLASGLTSYVSSGFKNCPDDVYQKRLAICQACPHYDSKGFGGTGRCLQCGCSSVKLKMSVASCPIKKWLPDIPGI